MLQLEIVTGDNGERSVGMEFMIEDFHATLNSIGNGIIVADKNGIITFINHGAEMIIGLEVTAMIGCMVDDLIPGARLLNVIETGIPEFNQRFQIGTTHVLTNRTPILKDGQIIGGIAVFQEITELNKVAAELEEVTKLKCTLQYVLESIEEGIVVVDKQGIITIMNPAYYAVLDKKPYEVIGKHVTEVIPNTRLHEVVKDGKGELTVIQKINGYNCVVSRIPIVKNREIICAVGHVVFKDIKDLKKLANEINQLQYELEYYKEKLRKTLVGKYTFEDIIGKNEKIGWVKRIAEKTAKGGSTVLILGESGTGKELFAHAIHNASHLCQGPFIKVNCAAIPENLLESELFGYEEGAFSGARKGGKPGKMELANGGTLFLDEVGDMPLGMQVKLLRVLQEREIERIGGTKTVKLDIRVITATNKDLEALATSGQFRQDLYYRLNVVSLHIPPLRERRDDIPLLCDVLLRKISQKLERFVDSISPEAMTVLKSYSWPGNVRELENVLERSVNIMDDGICILEEHLSSILGKMPKPQQVESKSMRAELVEIRHDAEKNAILKALEDTGGNKSKAALLLHVNRSVFYGKLKKYGIMDNLPVKNL